MAIQRRTDALGEPEPDGLGDEWRRVRAEARFIGSAVAEVSDELRLLIRREGELASAEVADTVSAARQVGMWGVAGALFGLMTLLFVGLGMMYGLSLVLELWAAALITAAVFALGALVAFLLARRSLADANPIPKRTIESIQEDMKWAREQMKRRGA